MNLLEEFKKDFSELDEYIKEADKGIWNKGQDYYYKLGKHAYISIMIPSIEKLEKQNEQLQEENKALKKALKIGTKALRLSSKIKE